MGLSNHRRHGGCVDIGEDAASHPLGEGRRAESVSLAQETYESLSQLSPNAHLLVHHGEVSWN